MKKTTLLQKSLQEHGVLMYRRYTIALSAKLSKPIGFKAANIASGMAGDAQFGLPPIWITLGDRSGNFSGYIADAEKFR